MKPYLLSLLNRLTLCEQAKNSLCSACERVFADEPTLLARAVDVYYNTDFEVTPVLELLEPIANKLNLPIQTINLLLIAAAGQQLERSYQERGYDNDLFEDFLSDITAKANECNRRLNIWGITTIAYWFPQFFRLNMFALGRLQYERYYRHNKKETHTVGGHDVLPQDMVYYIHIPSSGPLTQELCMDSYKRAYRFFAPELDGKPFVLYCNSWLLYERNREFMSPTSNIIRFMSDFKIVNSYAQPDQKYWGIFDMPYEGDVSVLPRNTSLQRKPLSGCKAAASPEAVRDISCSTASVSTTINPSTQNYNPLTHAPNPRKVIPPEYSYSGVFVLVKQWLAI